MEPGDNPIVSEPEGEARVFKEWNHPAFFLIRILANLSSLRDGLVLALRPFVFIPIEYSMLICQAVAPDKIERKAVMPKYLIEREIPEAGKLSVTDLQAISQKSCSVLQELGPRIQWVQSYVTGNKVYCVYIAPDEAMVREHARQGGFPANRVSEITSIIDPTTAEAS